MADSTLVGNGPEASSGPGSVVVRTRPQMLGKYRIDARLGKGGMGVVYQAEDTLLQRQVAIKVLPRRLSADPVTFQRFLLEARAVAKLSHPNIVLLYDINEIQGGWYLVMELVAGGSAQDALRRTGPFLWRDALRIVTDACRGLVAAHEQGLIHRDIKPANILRTTEGVSKLADFGLAKDIDANEPGPTSPETILGTPAFMSPEQCRAQPLDPRSDLYSLGATLYTLLTTRAPFEASSSIEVLYAHCNAPRPDPRAVQPKIPAEVVALLHLAMAVAPGDRFSSAREMLAVLERLQQQSEPEVPVVIDVEPIPDEEPVRKKRAVDTPTVVVPVRSREEPKPPATKKSGVRKKPEPDSPARRWLLGGLVAAAGGGGLLMLASRRAADPAPSPQPGTEPFWKRVDAAGVAFSVKGAVQSVALSPDLHWAAAITDQQRLYVWDIESGQPHATLHGVQIREQPRGLVFSADGTTLITGLTNKLLHITPATSGVVEKTPTPAPPRACTLNCLALAPDGTSLLLGRSAVFGWAGTELFLGSGLGVNRVGSSQAFQGNPFVGAVFTPDGREIVTLGADGGLRAWDAKSLHLIPGKQEKLGRGTAYGLSITPTDAAENRPPGAHIVVADDNGLVFVRCDDWAAKRPEYTPGARVYCVAFGLLSRVWAAGLADGRVIVRNNCTEKVFDLVGHEKPVRAVALGMRGPVLLSGGEDGRVRLWNVAFAQS